MEVESANADAKVVVITNLTRNVVEGHLQAVFAFYGDIVKIDLPVFGKSGQNRGKAALEYADAASAHRAFEHMDGGQLDGAVLKLELSDLPVRTRARTRSPPPHRSRRGGPPPDAEKNHHSVVDVEVGAEEVLLHHPHAIGIEAIGGPVHHFLVDLAIFPVEDPQVILVEDTVVPIVITVEVVVVLHVEEDRFVADLSLVPTLHVQGLLQILGLALQGADPQVIQFAPVVQGLGPSPVLGLHSRAR
ncbi:hypothetical protein AGABI1DRAFT_128163 [Agaricus bisporus var. burnettii JB137-S8]|uniref:RRM domain-containing protein n=2 Tax=Agaricus bisporus TaxID=5341 RepID=K5W112_AGABU|nr:uncharacterized protein AGABI1DRAFT_128163 [Agaricus bisporus var. burnettii JB137-S8]EKM80489.1 hypothetical protein AGABI1DRAFT_128163 [Agaricus bisporus var. burnettii JB137-S8]